jgi:enolase-phosphatase E1
VSDVAEELKAAEAAGMTTCQMIRFADQRQATCKKISSFSELAFD